MWPTGVGQTSGDLKTHAANLPHTYVGNVAVILALTEPPASPQFSIRTIRKMHRLEAGILPMDGKGMDFARAPAETSRRRESTVGGFVPYGPEM